MADALRSEYRVVGLDLEKSADRPGFDSISCDLTEDASVRDALEKVRQLVGNRIASVVHLAGYYDFSGEPSPLYRELTVEGTRRLLRMLQRFEVEQFVFSSTHILMKPSEEGEVVTERSPVEATWPYPKSKLRTERLIQEEHRKIPAVVLRVAGVYDENCHAVPIAHQLDRIAQKELESYVFPGDPDSGQAFVHLQDLVELVRKVIANRVKLPTYDVFLVAEPDKVSYEELQDEMGKLLHGREWPTIQIPKVLAKAGAWVKEQIQGKEETFIHPWMIDHADDDYPVSIQHAREALGWNPRHRLRDTLPAMVARMKQNPAAWRKMNHLEPSGA